MTQIGLKTVLWSLEASKQGNIENKKDLKENRDEVQNDMLCMVFQKRIENDSEIDWA